jgi:hypothetical protein
MSIQLRGNSESTFSEDINLGSGNITLNASGAATFSGTVQTGDQLLLPVITGTTQEAFSVSRGSGATLDHTAVRINYLYTSSTSPFAITLQNTGAGTSSTLYEINENGDHLIGGTLPASPNISLNANGSGTFAGTIYIQTGSTKSAYMAVDAGASGGAGACVVRCMGTNGTGLGGVELIRNATAWGAYSQRSLKTELVPISDGLTKVASLSAVTGRYKTDEQGTSRSFLIADEVQAVLPEAVSGDGSDENPLSLRYTEVIPLLVSALHDAKARIETLEAKVQTLEGGAS